MLSAELGMHCSDKTGDVSWLNPCRKQCAVVVAHQTSHGLLSASPRLVCSWGHWCIWGHWSIQLTGRGKGFPCHHPMHFPWYDWSSWWGNSHKISYCWSGVLSKVCSACLFVIIMCSSYAKPAAFKRKQILKLQRLCSCTIFLQSWQVWTSFFEDAVL